MTEKKVIQKPFLRLTSGERRFFLLIGDLVAASISLLVALYFWAQQDEWLNFSWQFLKERPPAWYYILPIAWILLLVEIYDVRRANRLTDVLRSIFFASLISGGIYLFIFFVSSPNTLPRRGVAGFIVASAILTLLWRLFYIQVFTAPFFTRRVMIVGAGRAGRTMAGIIQSIVPPPLYLVGYIDDDPKKIGKKVNGLPVLGGCSKMLKIVKDESISDLIFSISGEMKPEMSKAILSAEENGIEVTTLPVMYEELLGRVPIQLLKEDWILRSFLDESHSSGSYEVIKRMIDLAASLVGLVITAILFPVISLLILVDSGFPIFYKQKRLGKSGKAFILYKFRTMSKDAEKDGVARFATVNDERVTRVGKLLRKSRLDELPQFYNILRSDVSLVGPRAERPELIDAMQKKIPFYRARLFVKPGATGWAQVNYRYASTIEETAIKLEYDLYYIKHRNTLLDLLIIIRSFGTMMGLKGL